MYEKSQGERFKGKEDALVAYNLRFQRCLEKSGQRVKSDRINALRKQYDAFLEEDKRRKERNDYILGRLDKMRFCTTMVPVRHKQNVITDGKDILSQSLCQPVHTSSFSHHTLSVDVPRKPSDDIFLLQEISKKYILIPKTRPTLDVNVNLQPIRSNFEDNTDWQSKYDILEQLKRNEKESDMPTSTNKYEVNKNPNIQQENNDIHDISVHTNKVKPLKSPYKYEVPERDKDANISYSLQDQAIINSQNEEQKSHVITETVTDYQNEENDKSVEVPQAIELDTNVEHYNNNEQILSTRVNDNKELQSDLKHNLNMETTYVTDPSYNNKSSYAEQDDLGIYDNQYLPIDEEKDRATDTEKQINVDENEVEPIEVKGPNNFVNEINSNIPVQENPELQDNFEYPESINIQEFTPAGGVELHDVNVNPESYLGQENYNPTYQFDPSSQIVAERADEPVDTYIHTGIEAFETEQKEMFYSENADQSYAYEDGTVEGGGQNLTVQNTYPQQEEVVYYEGAETERDYLIETDEHSEAAQRYDPNYEEQYGAAYTQQYQEEAYEQQEFPQHPHYEPEQPQYEPDQPQHEPDQPQYESEQAQFEPEIVDQAQQGIEQFQFEEITYETTEQVQQQLDKEQGFDEVHQDHINEMEKPIEKLQAGETPINLN